MTHKTEPAFSDTTLKTLQAYNVQVTDDDHDIWLEELQNKCHASGNHRILF